MLTYFPIFVFEVEVSFLATWCGTLSSAPSRDYGILSDASFNSSRGTEADFLNRA